MEGIKHRFPFFFFFRRSFTQQLTPQQPVPRILLKESTMVTTISGNHEGGLCSVSDMQARDFKPWSHSPPEITSALSVTLAPEVTQKLFPGYTCHPQSESWTAAECYREPVRIRTETCQSGRLLRSHQAAGWSQQPRRIERVWPTFWSLTQTFLCIQLINALA